MAKRIRAKGQNPKDEVQQARYELYKNAIDQAAAAKGKGFYLEGITLFESLITDRLESLLSRVTGQEVSFKTLGFLIRLVKEQQHTFSDEFYLLVNNDLDSWRNKRNRALHELVKLEEGKIEGWENRYNGLETTYEKGYELFRQIDKAIREMT
jgi:hypothetical protein